jgi:hypothetical protein
MKFLIGKWLCFELASVRGRQGPSKRALQDVQHRSTAIYINVNYPRPVKNSVASALVLLGSKNPISNARFEIYYRCFLVIFMGGGGTP